MTFLELCQALAREAGVNGENVPTAVAGQTGELGRIVQWVSQAWTAIEGEKLWNFRWERPTLTMLATTSTLTQSVPETAYDKESLYLPAVGALGRFPDFLHWDQFRMLYPFIQAGPTFNVWTVAPDQSIRVDIAVNANVDFVVERYRNPVAPTADGDIPAMPADLHMLIVWRALTKYASFDEAGVQRSTAVEEHNRLFSQLVDRCLPSMRLGAPLINNYQ